MLFISTYDVWNNGKYLGKMSALLFKYSIGFADGEVIPDIGRKALFTWSKVKDNSRMLTLPSWKDLSSVPFNE